MKKYLMTLLLGLIAVTASAQTIVEKRDTPKFFDNTYVVVNGGVATNLKNEAFWKDMNANAGIRVGKDITPIFGVAVGSNAYFSEFGKQSGESSKWVKYLNTTALAKINVLNIFGYNPNRIVDLSVLAGPGWGHSFVSKKNDVTANFAINADFHVAKRLSIYVEPALIYGLHEPVNGGLQFNANRAIVQLNGGLVYHFGKTKFTKSQYVTLAEYDETVNALTAELAKKPKQVVTEVTKTVETPVLVGKAIVFFAQNSSELTDTSVLDEIPADTHVTIEGYASPEGTAEYNNKLSEERAQVVAKYLTGRGVIADYIIGKGVNGNTSNRVVIVY